MTWVAVVCGAVAVVALVAATLLWRAKRRRDAELTSALEEVRRAVTTEMEARAAAEHHKSRADLFASITHDLRTPLTTISTAASMLGRERELSVGVRRELIATIQESAERLDGLVSNVLQLSRSRAGRLVPRKTPAALEEILGKTVHRMRTVLRDRPVRLRVPTDLPTISVDVVQMDRVLANLLENAARFTPDDSEIVVSVERAGEAVELRIDDRGPGIPEGERERVFEPFVQLEPGGTAGLGLPIAKAIVEAHGGQVRIEDAPGGGTSMVLHLPVLAEPEPVTQKSA